MEISYDTHGKQRTLTGLKVIQVWSWLLVVPWVTGAVTTFAGFPLAGIAFLACAAIAIMAGLGLWKRKAWAHRLTLGLTLLAAAVSAYTFLFLWGLMSEYYELFLGSATVPFMLIISAEFALCPWVVWYLLRPHVKAVFRIDDLDPQRPLGL